VRVVQWFHVETFFSANFELHPYRAFLLLGEVSPTAARIEIEFMSKFEVWYAMHPLFRVPALSASPVHVMPENIPYPLKEAIELWNAREKRQVTYEGARKAGRDHRVKQGDTVVIVPARLRTWRPEGKQMTTLADIRRWLDSDERDGKLEVA